MAAPVSAPMIARTTFGALRAVAGARAVADGLERDPRQRPVAGGERGDERGAGRRDELALDLHAVERRALSSASVAGGATAAGHGRP